MTKALIVVDVQNDFCEGGSLAVEGGNKVAQGIATHLYLYGQHYDAVAFTKDWHKPLPDTNGGHFSDNPDYQYSWPPHCVAGTHGANLHPALPKAIRYAKAFGVFTKGYGTPSYSGFEGQHGRTNLDLFLIQHHITEVDIVGIAGDYCVKATANDAIRLGYHVRLITDLIASVGGDEATLAVEKQIVDNQRTWNAFLAAQD